MHLSIQEIDGTLGGILGVAPGFLIVAIVELLHEPAHVRTKFVHKLTLDLGHGFVELRKRLPSHTGLGRRHKSAEVGKAEVGLRRRFFAELLILIPQKGRRFLHTDEVVLDPIAHVAGFRQSSEFLRRILTGLADEHSAPSQILILLRQVAFQHQRQGQSLGAADHHCEMIPAEAQFIGLHPHVGLHHGRPQDQIQFIPLQLII